MDISVYRWQDTGDPSLPLNQQWKPHNTSIEYKIALITFKVQQPQYLSELIRYYEAPRQIYDLAA